MKIQNIPRRSRQRRDGFVQCGTHKSIGTTDDLGYYAKGCRFDLVLNRHAYVTPLRSMRHFTIEQNLLSVKDEQSRSLVVRSAPFIDHCCPQDVPSLKAISADCPFVLVLPFCNLWKARFQYTFLDHSKLHQIICS